MDNLQPGRNYSISVKAVSNGIESIERTVFQATRKSRSTGSRPFRNDEYRTYMTKPLPEYKAGHTCTHLYRRTGASHTGMLVGTGGRTIQGAGPSCWLKI
jgi:hypothetical protein